MREKLQRVVVDGEPMLRLGDRLFKDFDDYVTYMCRKRDRDIEQAKQDIKHVEKIQIIVVEESADVSYDCIIERILSGKDLYGFKL